MGMKNLNTTENNWETTWTVSQGSGLVGICEPEVEVIIPLSKCNVWWHFNFLHQVVLLLVLLVATEGRLVTRDSPPHYPYLQRPGLFSLFVIIWACQPSMPCHSGHVFSVITRVELTGADISLSSSLLTLLGRVISNNNLRWAKINITYIIYI